MMHDHHESLPGYSPTQILHDGCAECESRGADFEYGIAKLDSGNFTRAWKRAGELQLHGLSDASRAEIRLLRDLAIVQVQLERRGVIIGEVPGR